jgi:hypothetical protein
MPAKTHQLRSSELAMHVYAIVASNQHVLIASREGSRRLGHGEQKLIADAVRDRFPMSRQHSHKMVRLALDILGFGEPDRSTCMFQRGWDKHHSARAG